MDVTNCSDINGNEITELELRSDGTVWAVLEGVTDNKASYDCCVGNGFTFDPNDAMCYWNDTCEVDSNYKIILNPNNGGGAMYQIDEEDGDCYLSIAFKYLISLKCGDISSLEDILNDIQLQVSLEKEITDNSLPVPDNLSVAYRTDILNISDIPTFFNNNTKTGLTLEGDGCTSLINNLITDLGSEGSQSITLDSFDSPMVDFYHEITDEFTLNEIKNERLKIVLIGNNLEKYSIFIDEVKLSRVCDKEVAEDYVRNDCPEFILSRVIDNKKSWTKNDEYIRRNFSVSRRGTTYNINDDRLAINTKEVDILISPSAAVETDVWSFVNTNSCILDPAIGCGTGTPADDSYKCIDIRALMTTPLDELNDGTELLNELVDVKNNKTMSRYPTIELFYNRYQNPSVYCSDISEEIEIIDDSQIDDFVDLIGNFWSDIIEQVVPATTIWGRSNQFSNSVFGSSKFQYKKSTLVLCTELDINAPSPVLKPNLVSDVGVTTTDITDTDYFGPPELAPVPTPYNCMGVSVAQMDMGSEFIGGIIIIGEDDGNVIDGNTFSLNETISDECDTYYKECD